MAHKAFSKRSVRFWVPGTPVSQGSLSPVRRGGRGKILLVPRNHKELKIWREAVGYEALRHFSSPKGGPMALRLDFLLQRPKTVDREDLTVKPDLDKLSRAIGDALTGVVYQDDAQVTAQRLTKRYADDWQYPGVWIQIARSESDLDTQPPRPPADSGPSSS